MPKKIPYKEFLETFKSVPRVAISLVIKKDDLILLTKRDFPPFKDYWHLPGSFILKSESIKDCIQRILKEELEFADEFSHKNLFISEDLNDDPRGHVIDLIYEVNIKDNLKLKRVERDYFKNLPKNIGFNHLEVLNKLGFKL